MGKKVKFKVSEKAGSVKGIYEKAGKGKLLLVLGHGAGAPMHSTGMQLIADTLAEKGISTLRYNFPYMESGKKYPDRAPVAQLTVRKAVEKARELEPKAKIYAGGKSFGGRMTSQAESEEPMGVEGLVFYGFPLHAPGRDGIERADHLKQVKVPTLFLQGTRDALANMDLMKKVCKGLKKGKIEIIEGADHSFKVSKTKPEEVFADLAKKVASWLKK